jgi:hypothetical protein
MNTDGYYDSTEGVGRAADGSKPTRRDLEPRQGSYISYTARLQSSGVSVPLEGFDVAVNFAPPFDLYNYTFHQSADESPGLLPFHAPPTNYSVSIILTPTAPGLRATEPLTFTNSFYWAQMGGNPTTAFTSHTFTMQKVPQVFLPILIR